MPPAIEGAWCVFDYLQCEPNLIEIKQQRKSVCGLSGMPLMKKGRQVNGLRGGLIPRREGDSLCGFKTGLKTYLFRRDYN